MKEISILDFEGIRIGQAEDAENGTGCTVIIAEKGLPAGMDVRGGGPASRETELLKPMAAANVIHAVVLGGGSAFGLDAAGGVMQYLEEHDIGFDVGVTKVPLVCQSDIFDLTCGSMEARPTKEMGYMACAASEENDGKGNYRDGCHGAGTGATVGKMGGMGSCMKSGIGSYAVQIGELKVGALVVVNALGDIYDYRTGKIVAGCLNGEKNGFMDSSEMMLRKYDVVENRFTANTTIGIILTNASFDKVQLSKIAGMTHNGYARSIKPVHTSADGDTIYAMSTEEITADQDFVGTLAQDVMSRAIMRAVESAESGYGITALKDLKIEHK